MFKLRELNSDIEFDTYSKNFYESIGETIGDNTKNIPLEYFKNSYVVGIFNVKNEMVAGYILGFREPYRLLEFVPGEATYTLPKNFEWDQCAEIVCVWKKSEVSSFYTSRIFWPHIFSKFINSDKKYFLGHNQSERLNKYYSFLGPKSLYSGPSVFNLPSNLFIYSRFKTYIIRFLARTFIAWSKRHR